MITNYAKSVRAKLLNISRNEGISFQTIVTRYIHERFLQRLSESTYNDKFYLKGGALIYGIQHLSARPTLDIDLLGVGIQNDIALIHQTFEEILRNRDYKDAVEFLPESIQVVELMENRRYVGMRITTDVHLDTMKEKLSIDIGFGDIVIPSSYKMEYPTLLEGSNPISIYAYSIESVIAEKFEAMISLSLSNSRMKDFFDVFILLENHIYEADILKIAIKATFKNRGTSYIDKHPLFSDEFAKDKMREEMWQAYLKKIKYPTQLDYATVISKIKMVLYPIWISMKPTSAS